MYTYVRQAFGSKHSKIFLAELIFGYWELWIVINGKKYVRIWTKPPAATAILAETMYAKDTKYYIYIYIYIYTIQVSTII